MFDVSLLAHNIRSYRRLKGLTQNEIASALFVSPQSVSKWERGEAVPDVEKLCGLAKVFNVSLDELFGNTYEQAKSMIAVDGGGSKAEFLLFNSDGEILHRRVLGGTNPNLYGVDSVVNVLRSGIDEMLRIQPNVKGVFIGSSGFMTGGGEMVKNALQQAYPQLRIKCTSDMYNGVVSVVGERPCVASICGTGGIVFSYDKGEIKRFGGGYGCLFEEAGSGYEIGRRAICVALKEEDGLGEKSLISELVREKVGGSVMENINKFYKQEFVYSYVASFAPLVCEAYKKGDETAKEILRDNAERSAKLINSACEKFKPQDNLVALVGSLYHDESFLGFLKEYLNPELQVKSSDNPPIYGACLLCCRLCDVDSSALTERFYEQYQAIRAKGE